MHRMIPFRSILLLWGTYDIFAYAQNSSSHMSVWQTPQDLKVMEGANAQITCNFDMCSGSRRVTLKWEKDNKTLHSELIECQSNTNASRVLELKSLSQNQSGLYVCEVSVDIPLLKKGKGTGTNVTVTGRMEGPAGLIYPVAVFTLAFGVLFSLIIFFISVMVFRRFKRDTQSREDRAESNPQVILQEATCQNTDEITYASINKQTFSYRENQKRPPKQESVRSQTQGQGVEEPVLYSAIRTKHVD